MKNSYKIWYFYGDIKLKSRVVIQQWESGRRWHLIGLIAWMFLGIVLNIGCETNGRESAQQARLLNEKVAVYITGDVKREGFTQIRRELSKESVLEAAGGWAGFSEYGQDPKSIGITRIENGVTNRWKIHFDQMPRGKWKQFRFQSNDQIVVNILY